MEFMLSHTIGFLVVCGTISVIAKKYFSPASVTARIKRSNELLYIPKHHYRRTNPKNFPKLDHSFYYTTRRELENLGFRFIDYIEDVTANNMKICGITTFSSNMTGCGGSVVASFYDPRPSLIMRLMANLTGLRITPSIDLETYFTNGDILATSNSEASSKINMPSRIIIQYEAVGSAAGNMLRTHLYRLNSYRKTHPEAEIEVIDNYDKIIEKQQYTNQLRAEFMEQLGCITHKTISKMAASDKGAASSVDEIYRKIIKLEKK